MELGMWPEPLITLATSVLEESRKQHLKIATAESCTGGLIASCLTEIAGSSDIVDCGYVTYSNDSKCELLGVSLDLISANGAVSEPVAIAMARGALLRSKAQLAIAVTGIAGPTGGGPGKSVGLVHLAVVAQPDAVVHLKKEFGSQGRHTIRMMTVETGLGMLLDVIMK